MESQQRWYDKDETVSYMVKLIEHSDEALQLECMKIIIAKAKEYGVKLADNEIEESIIDNFFRRWYDKNKIMQEAFEYLRKCTFDVQIGIAHTIIEKIEGL